MEWTKSLIAAAIAVFCTAAYGFVTAGESPDAPVSAEKGAAVPSASETGAAGKIQAAFPELAGKLPDLLPPAPEGMEWRLVWHDEFDGDAIDYQEKWESPEFDKRRDGFWAREALSLTGDGFLRMSVFKDDSGRYLSACLRSRGKYEKAKGYFVVRMNSPHETGHWPAFWLFTREIYNIGNGSADGAEIDIMEKPWLEPKVNLAIHWDGYSPEHHQVTAIQAELGTTQDGFHTYGLWWGDDAYRFYIDGSTAWETAAEGICEKPTYIKLTDEIGEWGGDITKADLPDETLVDYVRVYDLFPAGSAE